MHERRKEPRHPLRLEAEVRFASWEIFRLIYTLNISRGGLNVGLPKEPKPGMELTVKLVMPSGPPLELMGVVRHTASLRKSGEGQFQVGVEFTNLDEPKREYLEKLIAAKTHGGPIGIAPKKT